KEKLAAYTKQVEELETEIKVLERRVKDQEGYLRHVSKHGEMVLDDEGEENLATLVALNGNWIKSSSQPKFVGKGYQYASGADATASYTFNDRKPGEYEVRLSYSPHANRSPNALVQVRHGEANAEFRVDQREPPP